MIFYILTGILAGMASGLGLGGGTILIPAFTIIYAMPQQQAQNINLIYFIPTAIIALITHSKNGNIDKKVILKIVIFGLVGSLIGASIALNTDPASLKTFFGYFLFCMGIYEFFRKPTLSRKEEVCTMEKLEFEKVKDEFSKADVDKKIELYISTEGLNQVQYKELLKIFPFNEIHRLEEALG